MDSLDLSTIPSFEQLFLWLLIIALVLALTSGIVALGGYLLIQFLKWRNREEQALSYVLMEVAVHRENEIKIDAMEQLFSSLYTLKKGGPMWKLPFLTPQDHISFEIVGRHEDIHFYVSVPTQHRDLLEKQIHGTYSGAVVREVEDYNLFF